MPPLFHLQVATLENRYEILRKIHDSVCEAGAWVTNFQKLSTSSVCLELEVSLKNLSSVHAALKGLGLHVDPEHDALLQPFHSEIIDHPEKPLAGTLIVRLLSNELDRSALPPGTPKA